MDAKENWAVTEESGQSIFEFVLFVPILLGLISIFISVTGAINGSINQQKAVRSYYYFINKGNPKLPSNFDLKVIEKAGGANFQSIGFFVLGYREKDDQSEKEQFAPCYPIHKFGSSDKNETCDDPDFGDNQTSFVRVFTAYGICGASYRPANDDRRWYKAEFRGASSPGSCAVKKN